MTDAGFKNDQGDDQAGQEEIDNANNQKTIECRVRLWAPKDKPAKIEADEADNYDSDQGLLVFGVWAALQPTAHPPKAHEAVREWFGSANWPRLALIHGALPLPSAAHALMGGPFPALPQSRVGGDERTRPLVVDDVRDSDMAVCFSYPQRLLSSITNVPYN
ncbi:MAG: hypothetical protein U1E42_15165 [Rhodospirillales bacterium]